MPINLNNEVDVLKQIFNNLTDADKIAFLDSIKQPPHELDSVLRPKQVTVCPHCGSAHFVKNGTKNERQRYLCRECKKSFVLYSLTILFRTHKKYTFSKNIFVV